MYNGNISGAEWRTANTDNSLHWYTYYYDALNRLMDARSKWGRFDERLNYDKNGNITDLVRLGHIVGGTTVPNINNSQHFGTMDNLSYTYAANSNKLMKVADSANKTYGFRDGTNTGDDYAYDANGNMTSDLNKGIGTSAANGIAYNFLNLPTEVKFDNSNTRKINYIYDATGNKLEKKVTEGSTTTRTFYAGNYVYEKVNTNADVLKFLGHPEGYVDFDIDSGGLGLPPDPGGIPWDPVVPAVPDFDYVYQYRDHLGNVRLSYADSDNNGSIDANSEIIEESNYYPFGLKQKGYNSVITSTNPAQNYKYNQGTSGKNFQGKEGKSFKVERQLDLGLNLDMTKFRMYDYALGRFTSIDPLADANPQESLTPYQYAYNSPIQYNDPYGNCPWCVGALVGALVDVAIQAIEISLNDTKSAKDFSWTSVGISAVAGATGVGLASKIKKAGTVTKLAIETTTDAAASAGTQLAKDGDIDVVDVGIDVFAGQTAGKLVGNFAESKFLKSGKGKKLQEGVNQQKNAERGKSNTISKSEADVKGAENKLTRESAARSVGTSTAASGGASTTASEIKKKYYEEDNK